MHLVTGYKGEEHIMSADQGSFNASFFGTGQYIMESGSQMEAVIIDNNTVRVYDGDLLMYGRHARIEPNTYEDLTIQTGTAGVNRYDLICATYSKNANDGTEDSYLQVIKGTESESVPDVPAYTDGNILEGATFNQMPLYKVVIEGVVLKEVVPMFSTIPTYQALAERYAAEFQKSCESHLDSLNVFDTLEEVEANTQEKQLAGALAVKELSQKVNDIDLSASKVNYDNTTSKLSATTAQGAIDELKTLSDGLEQSFSQAHDALVASLAYSGVGITSSMTFAQISAKLAAAYPKSLLIYNSGSFSSGYSKLTSTLQYLSGTYATQYFLPNSKPVIVYGSSSISITYKPAIQGGVQNGYTYELVYLPYLIDLTNFKYCEIICSRTLSTDARIDAVFTYTSPTESSTASVSVANKTTTLANGTNKIDISSLKNKQYLAFGCNVGAGNCVLAISKINFYYN